MSSKEACDKVRDYLFSRGAVGREAGPPDCSHLDDLTTEGTQGTEYTNRFDWFGLHAEDTETPEKNVPGLQIEGYFSDDPSTTTLAPGNLYGKRNNALNSVYGYDAQFVIRFPDPEHWKGRLVIAGAPGLRGQYANDYIISDHVLQKGCVFASTDKGNSGLRFYSADREPGDALAEWHKRIEQLTMVVKEAAKEYYGRELRTYITGNSNAGYLTRYALEKTPELYDGGVDWQGPLWTDPDRPTSDPEDKGPNLFTFLPQALKYYPLYPLRDARNAMIRAGFEPKQDFQWEYYYNYYWNSTEFVFRQTFDPYYASAAADYNYEERIDPQKNPWAGKIKDAVKKVSLTGDIKKPLITLHGTLDALLPITKSSDKYRELIEKAGRSHMHRYYRVEGGTHIDGLYDYPRNIDRTKDPDPLFREKLRPVLPCYKAAFDRLVEWVEDGKSPPNNRTVPKPERDVVNSCLELEKQE
jgi:tannase/feruloyl esterase/alpha/beta hydrolase family protein